VSIARPSTLQHYGRTTAKVTTTTLYDSSSLAQNTASLENDSTLVTTNTDGEESKIPSYSTLIKFAFTTILIWLSEPLLSLVDCTTVGMFASDSTIQLASLGPATTLTDSLLYLTYFLAISTTNQLAALLSVKDYRKLQSTTSHVLGVAVCLGLAVTATVFVAGTGLLRSMAGSSGTPELVYFAARYTTIRAAVAVAAVTGMVAQSFCLTVQDMKTPIVAMVTASVINVVGDIGLRAYGVQGAAYATAAACVASTTILMRKVRSQMQEWRQLEVLQQNSSLLGTTDMELNLSRTTNSDVTQIEVADLTMFNADNATHVHVSADVMSIASTLNPETHQDVPLFSLPDRESFVGLVRLSGPIFFVMLAKIACYGAMTIAATHFGVVALASHNIM
jgi:Na+-driven multidrug efflux pump